MFSRGERLQGLQVGHGCLDASGWGRLDNLLQKGGGWSHAQHMDLEHQLLQGNPHHLRCLHSHHLISHQAQLATAAARKSCAFMNLHRIWILVDYIFAIWWCIRLAVLCRSYDVAVCRCLWRKEHCQCAYSASNCYPILLAAHILAIAKFPSRRSPTTATSYVL
jgi:hypothetical protein